MAIGTVLAGPLRHRVEIQSRAVAPEAQDVHGGVTPAFTTDETRWASVEPLVGRELEQAKRIDGRTTHRVVFRHVEGLTPDQRLRHDNRVLNILSILNTEERNRKTIVMCVEDV